jgi:hypothetical protein
MTVRYWFSGPRILGGLVRPWICFNGENGGAWRKA